MFEEAEKILERSFAQLSIQDAIRKSERMPMPDASLVYEFGRHANNIIGKLQSANTQKREIVGFFGAPIIVIAKIWELIEANNIEEDDVPQRNKKEYLLWALHYLKEYPNQTVMCKTMQRQFFQKITEKTLRKWVWYYIKEVRYLEPVVIVWEHRKTNDRGDDCMSSVDCIDCSFQQIKIPNPEKPGKMMLNLALYSHKFNGPALRYEVATSILSDDIVWINGPFAPGDWNDLMIFRHSLIHQLEVGERMEADDIYVGEAPRWIVCPASVTTTEEMLPMTKRVEGRHEALNKHIKNWNCLTRRFHSKGPTDEKIEKHGDMFRACAVIKQVAMQMGIGELYEV